MDIASTVVVPPFLRKIRFDIVGVSGTSLLF